MGRFTIDRLTDHISVIDIHMFGLKRVGAVYLIQGEKTCLVDTGTAKEAKNIIQALDSIKAFPPDHIILTHSHFDHTQGAPVLCREARKRGRQISILASEKAIPNLKDQSWNRMFEEKQTFENIDGVDGLTDGQVIDLGGVKIEVLDFSGHCTDDIAIYEPGSKTVIVGDSLGYLIEKTIMFPPFMPPFWNEDGFNTTVEKAEDLEIEQLCLAHFGCLKGREVEQFLSDSLKTFTLWWNVYADVDKEGKLDDFEYLNNRLLTEIGVELPDIELSSPWMKSMVFMINSAKKLIGKEPVKVANVQWEGMVNWLKQGYKSAVYRSE